MQLPEALENLIQSFSRLPGIGEKSATRMALQMMQWNPGERGEFAASIQKIETLRNCKECNVLTDMDICSICSSEKRKSSGVLCIVESINDLIAIERSEQFFGTYYVLGGVLNPLLGIGPQEINLDRLEDHIKTLNTKNIILAVNPSVEGDATCSYIKELVPREVDVQRIGFGIPMGGSLEYVDSMTISKAFENRKSF